MKKPLKRSYKSSSKLCHCHSGLLYKQCCQPYHEGVLPQTAIKLMRSRYSAYALHLVDYIGDTTFDKTQFNKKEVGQFCKETEFLGLEILDASEEASLATVTFRATLMQRGHDVSFTEKSLFEKVNGRWLYKEGTLD